jgi:16S rRNA (guanine966-N2)-methyltransferase
MNKHLSTDKLVIVSAGPTVPQKPLPAPLINLPSNRSGFRSINGYRPKKPAQNVHNGVNQLRIIGGEWRSRKLSFPDARACARRRTACAKPCSTGWRRTSRGQGAGSVRRQRRAVSRSLVRGAAMGQALDASHAVSSLKEHLGTLRCTNGQVQTADALRYLETQVATPFDLVFLDPPFNQNLLPAVCTLLEERQWLAPIRGSTPKAKRASTWACQATGACTASKIGPYSLWQRMARLPANRSAQRCVLLQSAAASRTIVSHPSERFTPPSASATRTCKPCGDRCGAKPPP